MGQLQISGVASLEDFAYSMMLNGIPKPWKLHLGAEEIKALGLDESAQVSTAFGDVAIVNRDTMFFDIFGGDTSVDDPAYIIATVRELNQSKIQDAFSTVQNLILSTKPNDRSDRDRRYAILATELEKVIAYYHWYIA